MKLSRKIVALTLVGTFSGVAAAAGVLDLLKKKEPVQYAAATTTAKAASAPGKTISYEKDVKPILEEFCYDCHSDGTKKGGVALDEHADLATLMKDRKFWNSVAVNTEQRLMPPEKKAQPTQEQRDIISAWVKKEVFKADPKNPDPGRVTIRRLNRVEYNNTIRDLVGVDFDPADDFPADDTGYGFDNIGDVLSLSPIMLEKYMKAAQNILDKAIVVGLPKPPSTRYGATRLAGGTPHGEGRILVSNGEMFFNHKFPADGEYYLYVKAYGQQGGPQPVKMAVRYLGKDLKQIDVREVEDNPGTFEVKFAAKAGDGRVAVAFLNDYYLAPPAKDKGKRRPIDTNLIVNHVDVAGPINTTNPVYPDTHNQIFTKKPKGTDDRVAVGRELVEAFATRAFRRPVTGGEMDRLMTIFNLAEKNKEPFEMSVKLTLQAVLVSPHFLFRGEIQPEPDNPQKAHPINEYALASRLSYFLWSSMPDRELFDYARRGELRRNLAFQVQRMLRDNKSKALVENFAGQWLMLRNLDIVSPDPKTYPDWDDSLKGLMRKETEMFFEYIMREDRPLLDFLTADYTFVNEKLADHYNLGGVVGDKFQKVSLAGTQRSGVLTHGSILTITSNPTRTSPVKRGLWVLENLLATPPPPAPPDVPALEDNKEAASGSLRVRLEKHRADAGCASCHARMDPLGFGLENFDGIGGWREKDEGFKIDPAGKLVSGEAFAGPNELNKILASQKREEFLHCMAEKMLIYSLGRGLEWYDKPTLEQISTEVKVGNMKFSALIMAVVKSVPFQLRRGDGER